MAGGTREQGLGILDCLVLDLRNPNAEVGKCLPIPLSCLHLAEVEGIVQWKEFFHRYNSALSQLELSIRWAPHARRLQVNGLGFCGRLRFEEEDPRRSK